MLNNLIASLITIGGMGFMNFIVTDQLGVTDIRHDQKTEIVAYSLLWSIFDYAIYLVVSQLLRSRVHDNWLIVLSLISTLLLSFAITLVIARPLSKLVYWIYNHVPLSGGYADLNPGTTFVSILNNNQKSIAYIYNFNHEPITFGIVNEFSLDDSGQPELSLIPAESNTQPEYQSIMEYISQKDQSYASFIYTNFEQKIIIIFLNQN